jgi:serine/threonine protein kinase
MDIKPENIIYDEETKKVSIIDFEEKHTREYCSPEQILNKKITCKTDCWSLGATLYTLYTQTNYFEDSADILEKEIDFDEENMSYDFKDFLSSLLERNIVLRYSISEALEHVFLQ